MEIILNVLKKFINYQKIKLFHIFTQLYHVEDKNV